MRFTRRSIPLTRHLPPALQIPLQSLYLGRVIKSLRDTREIDQAYRAEKDVYPSAFAFERTSKRKKQLPKGGVVPPPSSYMREIKETTTEHEPPKTQHTVKYPETHTWADRAENKSSLGLPRHPFQKIRRPDHKKNLPLCSACYLSHGVLYLTKTPVHYFLLSPLTTSCSSLRLFCGNALSRVGSCAETPFSPNTFANVS